MPSLATSFIALALALAASSVALPTLPVALPEVPALDSLPVPSLDSLPIDLPLDSVTGVVDTVKGLLGGVLPIRRDIDVDAEVDVGIDLSLRKRIPDLPQVLASLRLDTNKATEAITSELANDVPNADVIAGQFTNINNILFGLLGNIPVLQGLGLPVSLSPDGSVTISNEEIANQLGGVLDTITGTVTSVEERLGADVPQLKVVFGLLDGTVQLVLKTIGGLVPEILTLLGPVLEKINPILADLGVGLGLGVLGL